MDISETYIKMRLQATQDLGVGKPVKLPLFHFDKYVSVDAKGDFYYDNFSLCQLERQDQLQDMVFGLPNTTDHRFWLISKLNRFFDYWDEKGIPVEFFTWEQLWLAFVMKQKYNKTWNGENWVK